MANTAPPTLQHPATSQGAGVLGTVRTTASEIIGVEVLPPILTRLRAQYPGLKIELLRPEPDVAERLLRPQQELLVARRMGAVGLGLHAHQSYMQQHGTPHSLAELAQHALIGFDTETPFIRRVGKSLQGVFNRDNFDALVEGLQQHIA